MQDILSMLNALQRPSLMMRAARLGAQDFRREVHLPRLIGYGSLPRPGAVLLKLIEIEAVLENQRTSSDASYSLIRHIDLLIAMVSEARVLQASTRSEPQ